jgi:acyl CoA:acetate/3-ketoacid CoA transferase
MTPTLSKMAHDGDIEAYNLPQGVLAQLLRESATRRPGLVTKVGLGTFCDPRQGGMARLPASRAT